MSETTRDTARYAATVARYQDLVGRLVGSTSMVATAEVSPDGTLVATILQVTDALEGRGHAELHVIAVDGGRRWQVTGAGVDAADPRWSLGGRRLSFLADIGSRHRPAPFALEIGRRRARRRAAAAPRAARLSRAPAAEPGRRVAPPRRRGRACRAGRRHGLGDRGRPRRGRRR